MNTLIQKLTGMAPMTEQVIATDLLMASKTAIKNYSLAITETATSEVRMTLVQHLDDVIELHRRVSMFMIDKGYYFPYDTEKQLQVDLSIADKALSLAKD